MSTKKHWACKKILWLLVLILLVVDGLLSLSITSKYQQLSIKETDLLGKNNESLKDFRLQNDGSIISETDDPWIEYTLEEAMYIKSVDIVTDWVKPERKYAQVYLILENGSWIYAPFYIHSGINTIQFNDINQSYKVSSMRFDLFSQHNCAVKIDQVIVNSRKTLTLKYHLISLIIIVFIVFIALIIKNIESNKAINFNELMVGIVLSIATSFLWCIFGPLDMYFNNMSEFWFDIYTLFPTVLIMFGIGILGGIIVSLIFLLIHKKLYQGGLLFLFIALICSYIQGTFLVNNLPPLDGSSFDWKDYSSERIKTLILWIIITLVVVFLLKYIHIQKMYRVIKYISGCLTGMLLLTLCIESFATNGYQRKLDASITVKDQFEMSNGENFIIFVLDALDAETFNNVMEYNPEYEAFFNDFTYYPNTMGAYSFTSRSIPFILSGEWFENNQPFDKYVKNVYDNAALFTELKKRNYKLDMYETTIPLIDKSVYQFENVIEYETGITSYWDFIKTELMLTGFKYAPFDLKKYCVLYPSEMDLLIEYKDEIPYKRFSENNVQLYIDIQTEPVTYTEQNSFKFIHIEGAHVPYQYDREVNIIENGTYEQNIEASMTIANAYLQKIKESGVYDNSVVIIMSDHGYIDTDVDNNEYEYGRQNPLLMVKGRFEDHELQISQAPISYDDLQSAYIKLLDGKTSDQIFDWKEGDERERRFLFYWYLDEDHMTEYIQTGDASDLTTMIPTGKEFNQ